MTSDDQNHVLVRPTKHFAGQPGEAEHEDGIHRPGGKPFRVSRQRRADLRTHGLIEDHEPEPAAETEADAVAAAEDDKRDTDSRPSGRRGR